MRLMLRFRFYRPFFFFFFLITLLPSRMRFSFPALVMSSCPSCSRCSRWHLLSLSSLLYLKLFGRCFCFPRHAVPHIDLF
ncbi:hypothetical protein F5I97DRAFT_1856965, partial [Phlebopus sp. FC_14]